jgi:16S rRNA (cytosine1402-N4)-methyltransferase
MEFRHISVLLNETVELLNIKKDGIYVDGTLGGGGHTGEICKKLETGLVIGIDQDKNALKAAQERLAQYNVHYVWNNFANIKAVLNEEKIDKIDGALLDLGVSSHQLDEPSRGFSYRYDAPLDMRMNQEGLLSAKIVVNEYDYEDLVRILFEYGEERNARQIAKRIIQNRPIETTFQLVDVIKSAFSAKQLAEKHPAKRTFQAIRIEVNGELAILKNAIKDFADSLNLGGRIAIITFHSLEDRIVKNTFLELAQGCTCPKEFPICICNNQQKYRVVTRKPVISGEEELGNNSRSASAKLRVLEKIL